MAGLSKKDVRLLLNSLEQQGSEIIRRKSGWTVRFANGDTLGVHETASDTKSFDAMRAIVRRAGLNWPFDGKDKKAMNAQQKRTHNENKELIQLWLDEHGVNPAVDSINPNEISQELNMSNSTVYRHLHALGWVKRGYADWQHLDKIPEGYAEELERALEESEPAPVEVPIPAIVVQPENVVVQSENDWIPVRLTKGIAGVTMTDLLNSYRAAGFRMEIRIRRDEA